VTRNNNNARPILIILYMLVLFVLSNVGAYHTGYYKGRIDLRVGMLEEQREQESLKSIYPDGSNHLNMTGRNNSSVPRHDYILGQSMYVYPVFNENYTFVEECNGLRCRRVKVPIYKDNEEVRS
jgi:hypothetical protein